MKANAAVQHLVRALKYFKSAYISRKLLSLSLYTAVPYERMIRVTQRRLSRVLISQSIDTFSHFPRRGHPTTVVKRTEHRKHCGVTPNHCSEICRLPAVSGTARPRCTGSLSGDSASTVLSGTVRWVGTAATVATAGAALATAVMTMDQVQNGTTDRGKCFIHG